MNTKRTIIVSLALALILSLAGCDPVTAEETRFTVGSKIYGIADVASTPSRVEVSLERIGGRVRQIDADEISDVPDIAILDPAGERIPVSEIRYRPDAGEMGRAVLVFDVSEHTGPWTLEWPDHDPAPLEGY